MARAGANTALAAGALLALMAMLALGGCGGGGGTAAAEQAAVSVDTGNAGGGGGSGDTGCTGNCADVGVSLTAADVQQVIAQAVAEAQAQNVAATMAVVDRVGNVLAVFRMTGSQPFITITSTDKQGAPVVGGLESVNIIPDTLAAVAKAVTGAYLSSEGNAFTTRTASQIVQEHFNPGERATPSGPLFGVQFSQLPCGDFVTRYSPGAGPGPGPHRSPLGLAADPGGMPLYKAGTPVGAIGVIADGIYSLDKSLSGFDVDLDERIAVAGTVGFAAPVNRRADVVTIIGKTGRFSDSFVTDLLSDPAAAPSFASLNGTAGSLVGVPGYYDGGVAGDFSAAADAARVALAGTVFGSNQSGVVAAPAGRFLNSAGAELDAFIFVDAAGNNRFPARAGLDTPAGSAANALTALEVQQLMNSGIEVANRARAQIRQPDGTPMRVTVSIVDSEGNIVGIARTRDAPSFGADVSLQKARTAAYFSRTGQSGGTNAAAALAALASPQYLGESPLPPNPATLNVLANPRPLFSSYVNALQAFIGVPDALEPSGPPTGFSDRAGGNLSRPFYPDGIDGNVEGPLSKRVGEWSIFSVGLQLDLAYNAIINHVAFVLGVVPDVGVGCTGVAGISDGFTRANSITNLNNGIQIFPGSVPIYRGNTLVGGFGVSGDGVDQDDMVSFLGTNNAGVALGGALGNAPPAIRADVLNLPGQQERLRYVNCPQAPFLDTDDDDVCDGL